MENMEDIMYIVLGLIGLFGFAISFVLLILFIFMRKKKRNVLFSMVGFLAIFIIGYAITPYDEDLLYESDRENVTQQLNNEYMPSDTQQTLNTVDTNVAVDITTSEPQALPKSQVAVVSYQSILDDYTKKIQEAMPTLIEEYEKEAAENQNGLIGLATISNAKIMKLAALSTEGITEMANFYFNNGSGKYSEYEDWAAKLQDVYMKEAEKITNTYMNSIN